MKFNTDKTKYIVLDNFSVALELDKTDVKNPVLMYALKQREPVMIGDIEEIPTSGVIKGTYKVAVDNLTNKLCFVEDSGNPRFSFGQLNFVPVPPPLPTPTPEPDTKKKSFPTWAIVLIIIVVLCGVVAFFVLMQKQPRYYDYNENISAQQRNANDVYNLVRPNVSPHLRKGMDNLHNETMRNFEYARK
jgi:hypothetical protein